jgi:hypothetical protein
MLCNGDVRDVQNDRTSGTRNNDRPHIHIGAEMIRKIPHFNAVTRVATAFAVLMTVAAPRKW